MEVFERWEGLPGGLPATAVALGYFDGLHLGHQAVIQAACGQAAQLGLAPAVFTFTGAGGKGKLILTAEQKHALLAEMGVAYCFEPPFESFRTLEPRVFFDKMLLGAFGAKALCCGADFAFGARRAGTAAQLAQLAQGAGVALQVAPLAQYGGGPISASRIRAALQAGQVDQAAAMLGRPYEIELPVRHGQKLGSTLGFPTINQVFPDQLQPPAQGVYITRAVVGGRAWPAVTGYGTRPTVGGQGATCETFIPGFEGDLYGSRVRVQFYRQIDKTRRFDSVEALAAAVQGWAAQALAYF